MAKSRKNKLLSNRKLPENGTTGGNKFKILAGITGIAILLVALFLWQFWASAPVFDGENAFRHIEKQCAFGARVPGSSAHQQCGDFLVDEFGKYADRVQQQPFTHRDRRDTATVFAGRNIIASFNLQPERGYRIMLAAHWDSRPFADKDPDSSLHNQPVPGANDGASGVAVLLEIARILHAQPLDFGVDIVLFDLEDIGDYGAALDSDSLNGFCLGSQYFAETMDSYRPKYGVLLDMIGDADLRIPREGYSQSNAGNVMQMIWQAAKAVNATAFVDEIGESVVDDHVPFLQRGIRVIDLIDFDYPYWHTTADTPDKCSAQSLQQVGDVLVHLLYQIENK